MITDADRDALKAAHGATTPGWVATASHQINGDSSVIDSAPGCYWVANFHGSGIDHGLDQANRDFAVLAHQKMPALLDELAFAKGCLEDLQLDSAAADRAVKLTRENERLLYWLEIAYIWMSPSASDCKEHRDDYEQVGRLLAELKAADAT